MNRSSKPQYADFVREEDRHLYPQNRDNGVLRDYIADPEPSAVVALDTARPDAGLEAEPVPLRVGSTKKAG